MRAPRLHRHELFRRADGREPSRVLVLSASGRQLDDKLAGELASEPHVALLSGRYEGIDDRIRKLYATRTISIGDFVLTGGELPSLVMADAVVRLLPGSLGSAESLDADSHSDGLLSAPQFTRPEVFRESVIPEVLKSGNHGAIEKWRRAQALTLTRTNRPDLFWKAPLRKGDIDLLKP